MGVIDEIKDRLDSACAGVAYLDCEGMPLESGDGPDAESDMRWMLARIEELEARALPRAPRWTECDGTEATLPPEGVRVAVKIKGATCSSGYVSDEHATPFWWIDSLQDFRKITIGDRWLPWPEGGE